MATLFKNFETNYLENLKKDILIQVFGLTKIKISFIAFELNWFQSFTYFQLIIYQVYSRTNRVLNRKGNRMLRFKI